MAIADIRGNGFTYSELRDQINRTHILLKAAGISPGDTVVLSLRNGPEMAAVLLAVMSYCRAAPLNPDYTATEASFVLRDVHARALITYEASEEHAVAAKECRAFPIYLHPADPLKPGSYTLAVPDRLSLSSFDGQHSEEPRESVLLLHTSGTTARPKLVPLTYRNLQLSSHGVAQVLELTPEDRCLSIMPLFHIHGIVAGLLASIMAGATVCCAPGFQATSFFSWLRSSHATWYTAVPTMHQTILTRARHNTEILSSHKLRLIRSSSAPLYAPVWEQLEQVFGVPVLNSYGMTEAAHQIASVRLPGGKQFRNTVGSPAGPDAAIMASDGTLLPYGETGEIVLRGEQITRGYLEPPGANESAFRDGWFRTGDEGFMNSNDCLTLTGRTKEMINSGGEKISPYEVEDALLRHPGVSQAVVFAMPHDLLGEQVAAAIVLREGVEVKERDLLQTAGQRLTRAKIPKRVIFLAEIPPSATGKLQRIGLAEKLGAALTGESLKQHG